MSPREPKKDAAAQQPVAGGQADAPDSGNWQFVSDGSAPASTDESPVLSTQAEPIVPQEDAVGWTASEYVSHRKGGNWYLMLLLAVAALAGLVFLLTRDRISTGVVVLFGVGFGVFAAREPNVLEYAVDSRGIFIGPKFYPYNLFRSFSVLQEDALHSIFLMPQKRFSVPITIYYDPKDEAVIVEVIGSHIPHEERKVPSVDRLMGKIHF